MRLLLLIINFISLSFWAQAQQGDASFELVIVSDSILMGHTLAAHFTLKQNGNGNSENITFPNFSDFHASPGPTSIQTNVSNGVMSQVQRYTYYLEPKAVGDAYIGPASVKVGETYLETAPQLIRVYPNPDNIPQQAPQQRLQSSPFEGNPFGDDPFSSDFFQGGGMNFDFFSNGFNQLDSLQEGFFQDFFQNGTFPGLDFELLQPDSVQQQVPKRRKTTRI